MRHFLLKFLLFFIELILQLPFGISDFSHFNSGSISGSLAGEFKYNLRNILMCNPNPNKIQMNYFIVRKSNNVTEVRGNSTVNIIFDDTLFLEINMAFKQPNVGWKENVLMHKLPKACSSLKLILGNAWPSLTTSHGVPNITCPIPMGVYVTPGLDPSVFMNSNVPKTFMYGTYKIRISYSRNDEMIGCMIGIVDLYRPKN